MLDEFFSENTLFLQMKIKSLDSTHIKNSNRDSRDPQRAYATKAHTRFIEITQSEKIFLDDVTLLRSIGEHNA